MIITVANAATLISAVNTIDSLGEGTYFIAMAADIVMPEAEETVLRFSCGDTTILGCGHTLSLQPADDAAPAIAVEGADTRLSLGSGVIGDSLTITGRVPEEGENYPSLIAVYGGALTIHDGVTVTGHRAGHGAGGALRVEGGSVWMLGGSITDCGVAGAGDVYGGGVCVLWGGSFYMYGGGRAESAGGISFGGGIAAVPSEAGNPAEGAAIQLLGGSITGCGADRGGGAAFAGYPGAAVLGDVVIERNAAFGDDAASGGGVWYDAAEGFALYMFGACEVRNNTCECGETGEEASDICGCGGLGETSVRVGVLKAGAFISFGDGENVLLPEPLPDLEHGGDGMSRIR